MLDLEKAIDKDNNEGDPPISNWQKRIDYASAALEEWGN